MAMFKAKERTYREMDALTQNAEYLLRSVDTVNTTLLITNARKINRTNRSLSIIRAAFNGGGPGPLDFRYNIFSHHRRRHFYGHKSHT